MAPRTNLPLSGRGRKGRLSQSLLGQGLLPLTGCENTPEPQAPLSPSSTALTQCPEAVGTQACSEPGEPWACSSAAEGEQGLAKALRLLRQVWPPVGDAYPPSYQLLHVLSFSCTAFRFYPRSRSPPNPLVHKVLHSSFPNFIFSNSHDLLL